MNMVHIYFLALGVRLAYVIVCYMFCGDAVFLIEDSEQYVREAAIALELKAPFGWDAQGHAVYSPQILPLIPLTMQFLGVSAEADVWRFIAMQCILDAGSCVLIARAAEQIPGANAHVAGIAAALNPTQIVLAGLVLTDTFAVFFLTLALLGLLRLLGTQDRWALVFFLLGSVLAIYTRFVSIPVLLGLAVLMLVLLLGKARRQPSMWRKAYGLVAVCTLTFAMLQPIAMRNNSAFGYYEFSDQYGVHMLFWVVPLVRDLGAGIPQAETLDQASVRYTQAISEMGAPENSFAQTHVMNEIGSQMFWESGLLTLTKAWVIGSTLNLLMPAPATAPWARGLKTGSFTATEGANGLVKALNFVLAPENRAFVIVMGIGAFGLVFWLAFGVLGFRIMLRDAPLHAILLLGLVVVVLAVAGPVVSPKYRLPLEPAWCLFLASAIPILWQRWRGVSDAVR